MVGGAGPGFATVGPSVDLTLVTEVWPPYVQRDEVGRWSGVAVEILESAAASAGLAVEIVEAPWRRALAMAERGEVDGIFPLNRTPEREEWLRFPENSVSESHGVFFHRVDRRVSLQNLRDLAGHRVGVIAGYQYAGSLLETPGVLFEEVPTNELALRMLARGRIDLLPADRLVGVALARSLGLQDRVTYYPRPLDGARMYVGLSRRRLTDRPELAGLLDRLDRGLGDTLGSERHRRILARWGADGELSSDVLGP